MNKIIARLIDSGIPRECAVRICQHFRKYKTISELLEYVAAVEAETNEQMEVL